MSQTSLGLGVGAALLLVPALSSLMAKGLLAWRDRSFAAAEAQPAPDFLGPWADFLAERTQREAGLDSALRELFAEEHRIAIGLQRRSLWYLANAGSILFLAFVAFAVAATIFADIEAAHVFAAAFEAVAFVWLIYDFHAGVRARRAWIAARARIELLRQWTVADYILAPPGQDDLTSRFIAYRSEVERAVTAEDEHLVEQVRHFSLSHIEALVETLDHQPEISSEAVAYYLQRRPIRQARWFEGSRARLVHERHARANLLLGLFVVALICAVGKLALGAMLHHGGLAISVLSFLLLLAIGFSSMATAYYVGQNGRTLSHQYSRQLRDIETWFADHASLLNAWKQARSPLRGSLKSQFLDAVRAFEILMLNELLDWIEVSEQDAMEPAP